MCNITKVARNIFDVILFLAASFVAFALRKWIKPFKRGFFCNDESLMYPVRENTISISAVIISVLSVPSLIVIAVELFKPNESSDVAASDVEENAVAEPKKNDENRKTDVSGGYRLVHRLVQCYKNIGFYLFGAILNLIATEVGKYCIGRLRPYFFAVCQPQMPDGTTCADVINHGRYIESYTCTGRNATDFMLEQLNQSFPSGHASTFFYAMIYLTLYLQATLSTRASKLLKHLLQFTCVLSAIFVGLTRVSDYWHHWSDVLAGAILGTVFAICMALFVADIFKSTDGQSVSGKSKATSVKTVSSSAKSPATVLPAYTFGTMPYPHYPHHYGQQAAYHHNYGYVS